MGFTSFLKTLAQDIGIVAGVIAPYRNAVPAVGGLADKLDLISKTVVDVEIVGQAMSAPGAQKAAASAGPIFQVLMDLPILQGKKPKDEAKAKAAAAALGGALADFLNSFES